MTRLPPEIVNWLNKQNDKVSDQLKKNIKNFNEDENFIRCISSVIKSWSSLRIREKEFVCSLIRHHDQQRCFSIAQRSAIVGLYLKTLP